MRSLGQTTAPALAGASASVETPLRRAGDERSQVDPFPLPGEGGEPGTDAKRWSRSGEGSSRRRRRSQQKTIAAARCLTPAPPARAASESSYAFRRAADESGPTPRPTVVRPQDARHDVFPTAAARSHAAGLPILLRAWFRPAPVEPRPPVAVETRPERPVEHQPFDVQATHNPQP